MAPDLNSRTATCELAAFNSPELQLTARVEEQTDPVSGDIIWTLLLAAATYDRRQLDRVADQLGCELVFAPVAWGAS